jgi:hypothetical protein
MVTYGKLGFHDTNLARVKAAQAYLNNCDEVFIVARIARVITDLKLKSSLQAILKDQIGNGWESHAKQSSNITIVCTNAEVWFAVEFVRFCALLT